MKSLIFRIGLLALALGGTFLAAPHWRAPEQEWSFTYNASGLLESTDGPRIDVSDITRYEHDQNSNLVRTINALGHTSEISNFDHMGNPRTVVDSNGVVILLTYTPQGWLSSSTVGNSTTKYDYNAAGDITKLTKGDGSWLIYTWDDARRLIRIENSLMEQVELELDAMGNQTAIRMKDKEGTITKQHRSVYDEMGRLLESVGASGQVRHMQYDLNDNPINTVTPRNTNYINAYDPLNRLIKSTDPLNGTSQFEYDAQDNLTLVRDARGVSTRYHFDGLGNLTQQDSPDSGTSKYKYDTAGNITEKTDARGVVTSYAYDALNRVLGRRYPSSPALDVRFHYDSIAGGNKGVGRLTAIEDANGIQTDLYDVQGNIIAQQNTPSMSDVNQAEKIGYGYDKANRLNRIDYPAGFSIHYLRDAAGQVNQIQIQRGTETPTAFAQDLTYLPFGPLKSLTWANGITLQRTFDKDYLLTSQLVGDWGTTYNYDANGNITQIKTSALGVTTYKYDSKDHITEESNAGEIQTFKYDAAGNRISRTHTSQLQENSNSKIITYYSYGRDNNRLVQIDDQAVIADAAGNIINYRPDYEMTYGDNNRTNSAEVADIPSLRFRYNAQGQRTQKANSTLTTNFIYGSDGQLLGEARLSGEGKIISAQYYIWLEHILLGGVVIDYGSLEKETDRTNFYAHSDHLNTPHMITNELQEVIWNWTPDTFGNGKVGGSLSFNLRFPGQYYDVETRLHYNYYRDYDPKTGRYIQSDPIGLNGGLNTYAYANSNPLKYIDPTGQNALLVAGTEAGAAIGTLMCPGAGTIFGGAVGASVGAGLSWFLADKLFSESVSESGDGKKPIAGLSGKDGAKDIPSWAKGERPFKGESGKDFADRLLGEKYGKDGYDKGPASEHNKIKKWGDRAFE